MSLIDNFESYNLGNIIGQGTWTGNYGTPDGTNCTVQNTVKHSGSQALKADNAGGGHIDASFSLQADGGQIFYFSEPANPSNQIFVRFHEGSNLKGLFCIPSSDGKLKSYYSGSYHDLGFAALANDTWYKITIEWRSSDKKFRVSLDDVVSANGWETAYANFTSGIDNLAIDARQDSGTKIFYWDDFSEYVVPSGPANLKTWNGLQKSSIKTINSVPIASVKSWNGLA